MKYLSKCLLALTIAANITAVQASEQMFESGSEQVMRIKGRAVTGANRLLGQPVQNYGPNLGTFGFYNIAVYNPDGNEPVLIDENTAEDAILATAVDPTFLIAAGLPLSLIDESLNNIPLNDVGVNVSIDGETRMALPSTLDVDPLTPNRATSLAQVTLKDWLSAKGSVRFKCTEDGNSVSLRVKNLMPNRLYTAWGLFESAEGKFKAVALGGTPNAIVTDSKGRGSLNRELGFCPMEETESGARMIAMDVIYHSDHQVYAAVPGLALKQFITGTNTHSHLWFTVFGESLLDD